MIAARDESGAIIADRKVGVLTSCDSASIAGQREPVVAVAGLPRERAIFCIGDGNVCRCRVALSLYYDRRKRRR